MKVIDLLNKIAKDEEVPKEIWYSNNKWEYRYDNRYHNKTFDYPCKDEHDLSERFGLMNFGYLNDEIEIIEEEKEIEELKIEQVENGTGNFYIRNEYGTKCCLTKHSKIMADKINELVREVRKLKKEGK